jgi:S-formylglutathione hydrolase FrmB
MLLIAAAGCDGQVRAGSPGARGITIVRYRLHSHAVRQTLPQVAALPAGGGGGRPLLVFLHGRGGAQEESNANSAFFGALAALGARAPDVVFPNGGDHSYWHARSSGNWSRYVLDEVIPRALAVTHADPQRIAIGGISMGGYGAFEIAALRPAEFCAVGGHSAALWLAAGDSAPGAFDDRADFQRHDVLALARHDGRRPWGHARLWLDGGQSDPFHDADTVFAHELGIPLHVWPGDHDATYWQAHYGNYVAFYANALMHCR